MKIEFCDLRRIHEKSEKEIEESIKNVLRHGKFINGPEVAKLEEKLAKFIGVEYAIGLNSGTDALLASLIALNVGRGDYVITTSFSFFATASVISFLGAIPIFVDIDQKTYNLSAHNLEEFLKNPQDGFGEKVPLKKIKAIIVVDIFGQCADYEKILEISRKNNLSVIEDGAQSFGAKRLDKNACSFGDLSTTSFFPAKPLGGYGDGGMVFTKDKELALRIREIRNHGQSERYEHNSLGLNMRLDSLQAAVLLAKFTRFSEKEIEERNKVARTYNEKLKTLKNIVPPFVEESNTSVWAQYSILVNERDKLRGYLKEKGIPTAIHYPKPLHLQKVFEYLGYKEGDFPIAENVSKKIISLPMDPLKSEEEISFIVSEIKGFYNNSFQ